MNSGPSQADPGSSTLAALLPLAMQSVREYKTRTVRQGRGDQPTLMVVECWRGAEQVASVLVPPTPDKALTAIATCAVGFAADTLGVSADTWMSVGDINPVTGRPWQPGEVTQVVQHHNGVANGWVVEAMNVLVVNRAGDVASMSCPYTVTGRRIDWGQQQPADVDDEGLVGELVRVMALPDPVVWMHRAGVPPGAPGNQLRDEFDCQTALLMQRQMLQVAVMLYAEPGSPRHQLIRRRLPGGRTIRPRRGGDR